MSTLSISLSLSLFLTEIAAAVHHCRHRSLVHLPLSSRCRHLHSQRRLFVSQPPDSRRLHSPLSLSSSSFSFFLDQQQPSTNSGRMPLTTTPSSSPARSAASHFIFRRVLSFPFILLHLIYTDTSIRKYNSNSLVRRPLTAASRQSFALLNSRPSHHPCRHLNLGLSTLTSCNKLSPSPSSFDHKATVAFIVCTFVGHSHFPPL